jgi:hypothetical protein
MSHLHTALIDFQNAKLPTAYDETTGKTYVALKPIVEGMGLDWWSQLRKIKEDDRYSLMTIPYITKGGTQEMVSLDADHLPAFLYSINPNRVRKDLRDRIITFQRETFAVINAYWRKKLRPDTFTAERIATLEQRIYALTRENTELRRGMNRITRNDRQLPKLDEKLAKLWIRGVIPELTRRLDELGQRIGKELGSVGDPYVRELEALGRFFKEKPQEGGNFTALGDTLFPHALIG